MNDTFATLTLALQNGPAVPGAPVPGAPGNGTTLQPGTNAPPPPAGQQPGGGFGPILWMIILMFVVLMLITSMSGRRQRREREKMVSGIKRNDRVQTVGGVIGTVIELTDTEMVLRVDETSNTRIRFARTAVQQVLREGKEGGKVEGLPAT
jgi:preprotein translocase subunit YajC